MALPRGVFHRATERVLDSWREWTILAAVVTGTIVITLFALLRRNVDPVAYRCRLRFRVQKKLKISAHELKVAVADREVVLSAPLPDQCIADSEWLILNARGFAHEQEASDFGHRLRAALELSSIATRLGIDAGRDLATSGLGNDFRRQIAEKTGQAVRDNVHGIDVFVDAPNIRFFTLQGTGTIHKEPEPFLGDLASLYPVAAGASARAKDVILLLNTALMQPHPVAQIVFAISAVEMLGQDERWTEGQAALLKKLADEAEAAGEVDGAERREVADAIRRSQRFSLRQGVFRLLDSLELAHLKPTWDATYGERSKLIHGLAPQPGADYSELAFRVLSLCGRILLKAVAVDVPEVNRHVDRYYELRQVK